MLGGLSLHVCVLLEMIYQQKKKTIFRSPIRRASVVEKICQYPKPKDIDNTLEYRKMMSTGPCMQKRRWFWKLITVTLMSLVHCQKWASYANVWKILTVGLCGHCTNICYMCEFLGFQILVSFRIWYGSAQNLIIIIILGPRSVPNFPKDFDKN